MNALVTIPTNNVETYRASTDAANLCREIVLASATEIQGRKYVCVEGWQAIAIAHGCAASARDVERVEGGIRAIGEIRRMSDGKVIAEAEGFVGEDEATWFGGEVTTKWGKKSLPKRADYAIRAMAQTRAISRACRSAFAHVVVMMNAGLQTTPAEEVPYDGFEEAAAAPPAKAAPADKPAEKTADWKALDDEMDRCRSVAELEAWNLRRAKDIKALPKVRYEALGVKFGDLRQQLPDAAPATTEAPADEFGLSGDDVPEFN